MKLKRVEIPNVGNFEGKTYAAIMVLRTIAVYASKCPLKADAGIRQKINDVDETWKFANVTRQVLSIVKTVAVEEPEMKFLHFEIPNMGQFLVRKYYFHF